VQIAKHGKIFRMEQAQMDSPVSLARRRSDSELVRFLVKARHPATAVGPRDRAGTRERWQGPKSVPLQLLDTKVQIVAHQSWRTRIAFVAH